MADGAIVRMPGIPERTRGMAARIPPRPLTHRVKRSPTKVPSTPPRSAPTGAGAMIRNRMLAVMRPLQSPRCHALSKAELAYIRCDTGEGTEEATGDQPGNGCRHGS